MVVLVLASGAVITAGQVRLREPFWTTPYGKALLAKLAFVAVVLAIGGYNRQKVVPGVADHDDEAFAANRGRQPRIPHAQGSREPRGSCP